MNWVFRGLMVLAGWFVALGALARPVGAEAPDDEWPSRRASALAGGVEDRCAAAWWALENGLTPEAIAMLRAAQAADPTHPTTARMVAALDRLAGPLPDPEIAPLRRVLGGRGAVARGPHVILLHQHSDAEATGRVEILERVVVSFYLSLAAQGFDLPAPRLRLASVWFARQSDYQGYLHAQGADAFLTTLGYYHPTKDLVVVFDLRDNHRRRRSFDRDWRAIDLGTGAHEMVHQLVAQSGLAPRQDAFPVWLHEGFAAQFEVVRGGRWAGIGKVDDLRLPGWRRLRPPPRLVPLVRDVGFGHEPRPDAYSAAWALVYFLRKQHPREFVTFLDLLRLPDLDPEPSPDRSLAAFRAAFGVDLQGLEAEWHRFMSAVETAEEMDPEMGW